MIIQRRISIREILKQKRSISFENRSECEGVRRCNPVVINPQKLPNLPIQPLENTMRKFLKSCEPFVTYLELQEGRRICDIFQRKEGKVLQKYLYEKADKSHNWLDDWYTKCAYLCNRDSLPMNTSPIIILPPQKFRKSIHYREYIAKLILAILKFWKKCNCDEMPVEKYEQDPLEMEVYKKLFGNIRLPKYGCDELVYHHNARHIVVMYKNNIFKFQSMNNCGEPLSFAQIMSRLDQIMTQGWETGTPFGLLTCLNREKWAGIYEHMKMIPGNDKALEQLEKAMCIINIDEPSPCELCTEDDDRLSSCQNGFHGYGPKVNGANRWYGKTLQFYVTRDGCSGIILEHSPVETILLGKMSDFIFDYVSGNEWRDVPDAPLKDLPQRVNLINTSEVNDALEEAATHLQEKINDFRVDLLHYKRYGRAFIKEQQMSSDAVIQMALQYAFFRCHHKFTPQHETANMRRFFLGRTDIIRTCTNEAICFVKALANPGISIRDKYECLKIAAKKHKELRNDVIMGKGIDRHLFGLYMASKEMKMKLPDIFKTEVYDKSGRFKIVTRQNQMYRNCFVCYAPGADGGYSCSYNPRDEDINMCVTSKRSEKNINPGKFLHAWGCSMKNIADLMIMYQHLKDKQGLCK